MPTGPITIFAEKVLDKFSNEIADHVFLMIENDRKLLQEYLRLISTTKLDTVNQLIGKKVKKRYDLTNAQARQKSPKSKLIKSYQKF